MQLPEKTEFVFVLQRAMKIRIMLIILVFLGVTVGFLLRVDILPSDSLNHKSITPPHCVSPWLIFQHLPISILLKRRAYLLKTGFR